MVPPGVNPIVQMHEREVALPAEFASGLRNLIASGGRGGDIYIKAWDTQDIRRGLRKARGKLARELVELARDGRTR